MASSPPLHLAVLARMASPWFILEAAPRVGAADEHQNEDLSAAMAAPPGVTLLTVHPRISPGPDDAVRGSTPFVLAADPCGLLLLQTPPSRSSPTPRLFAAGAGGCGLKVDITDRSSPGYYVCDAAAATAFRLPSPEQPGIFCAGNMGLVAAPGSDGGRYVVAELQYIRGDTYATLLSFSSETGAWARTRITEYPLQGWIWRSDWVISHDGKLWWVDLTGALLICNPFAEEPTVAVVPLPRSGCILAGSNACHCCAGGKLRSRRLVQVSDCELRFVQMSCITSKSEAAPMVSVWSLKHVEAKKWTLDYQTGFAEVWADDSYKATGLPAKRPVIVLFHPRNPCVVHFFLEGHIFAVNLPMKKVVACTAYAPPGGAFSTGVVMPWELPQPASALLPEY